MKKENNEQILPREKALMMGIDSLSDAELLALILNTGSLDIPVMQLAVKLLEEFKSFRGLLNASLDDLCQVKGIKKAKALKLMAIIEITKRINDTNLSSKQVITSSESLFNIFGPKLRFEPQEVFIVVFINTKNRIIGYKTISKGGLDFSLFHPRDVFREAVKNNASKIVFIHNHPSGDPNPSTSDISTTKEFMELGEKMGIPLIEHIIIGEGHFYSFKSGKVV